VAREGRGKGGEGRGGEGREGERRGGEKGRGRSSPNVRDALTPLLLTYRINQNGSNGQKSQWLAALGSLVLVTTKT